MIQKLLISVRGKKDALEAVAGGAHIIDAENPSSSLGTAYPLNIHTIRKHTPPTTPVSTNIGEKQFVWSTAAQAALGVAVAGADIIKVGLADLSPAKATRVMRDILRHVHYWYPQKIMIPTFFADDDLRRTLDPVAEGAEISQATKAQGILIDTFDKKKGKGLLDYLSIGEIARFVKSCHSLDQEAWVAGSIAKTQLPALWKTRLDVICVRRAACKEGRMGRVSRKLVRELVNTIP